MLLLHTLEPKVCLGLLILFWLNQTGSAFFEIKFTFAFGSKYSILTQIKCKVITRHCDITHIMTRWIIVVITGICSQNLRTSCILLSILFPCLSCKSFVVRSSKNFLILKHNLQADDFQLFKSQNVKESEGNQLFDLNLLYN